MPANIALAAIFLTSCCAAIAFLLVSDLSRGGQTTLVLSSTSILLAAFYLSGSSAISPFSVSGTITLGAYRDGLAPLIGIMGAVLGIVGSVFFEGARRTFAPADYLRPLAVCPMTLIPIIKLIETSDKHDLLSLLLLFCMSYQTGFFWERVLKQGNRKSRPSLKSETQ